MTIFKDRNFVIPINIYTRTNIPDSDFADPTNRTYPIIDENHVRSAMQSIMWQVVHLPKIGFRGNDRVPYLQKVHDRILERARELHMNFKHDCELCDVKVQFT